MRSPPCQACFFFMINTPLLPCSHFYALSVWKSCLYGYPALNRMAQFVVEFHSCLPTGKECIPHTVKSYSSFLLIMMFWCLYLLLHAVIAFIQYVSTLLSIGNLILITIDLKLWFLPVVLRSSVQSWVSSSSFLYCKVALFFGSRSIEYACRELSEL